MPYKRVAVDKIVGSAQQEVIWDAIRHNQSNTVVEARAGTGKTFTMVEGLKRVSPNLTSCFVAFNKSIAEELATQVPKHSRACTLHSLGNAAIKDAGYKPQLKPFKTADIIRDLVGRSEKQHVVSALSKLVGYCKNTLLDGTDIGALKEAAFNIGVDDRLNPEHFAAVPAILDDCKSNLHCIDFDDMIWLPQVLDLPIRKYDFLVVDESQDMNAIQQQLALRAGHRIVVVGDPYQSIYAFRGADVDAMSNLTNALQATEHFAETFPLTVSRRCPQLAVALVEPLVGDFECMPDAVEGVVRSGLSENDLPAVVQGGDLVLSRVNAPLLSLAYRLLKQDIPCKVQGKDIGEGLRLLVAKIEPDKTAPITQLLTKASSWVQQEESRIISAYQHGVESKLAGLHDRYDCLRALTEGCNNVAAVNSRISLLFADVNSSRERIVLLSSIHKAKGLEAEHVFVAKPEVLPHPMARTPSDRQQELNLAYVAATRFKKSITFMGEIPHVYGNVDLAKGIQQ